ncbi:T6SS immunity protein Tli4 family protein [Corallococcus llansteffanensis]|nr:T6SS immunity protein Tli4 family protein [Corallococcus llansteffanensis]
MSQSPAKGHVRQCVGRFYLDVPDSMSRSADVETYQVQHISLKEALWKDPADEARSKVWESRLDGIRALTYQQATPEAPQGTILAQRAFSPEVRGVLYHRFDTPLISTWGALLHSGAVDVWMQIDGDLEREQDWATRLKEVSGSYRLPATGESLPHPGKDWFYLRHGMVALPTKYQEEARVRFEGTDLKVKVDVWTRTTTKVKKESLLERYSNTLAQAGEDSAGDIVTQKYQARTVAGLPGEELIIRYKEGKQAGLYFLWSFPGEEKSGARPRFNIEMDTGLEQEDAKVGLWNNLLGSVRPVKQ